VNKTIVVPYSFIYSTYLLLIYFRIIFAVLCFLLTN